MSKKWMGGPNHILQHVPSENPTQNPTTGPLLLEWCVVAIWPPTTYKACQTPFICMKWIWYEYEVDGRSQSYPTACPQWEPHSKSYDPAHPLEWWYSMVLWQYGCQPWLKAFKHFQYVWSGSSVSMKWILALTLSWWCDLYPVRGTRPGQAVTYYGQIMYS
jgi:hypothetical protein